MSCLVTSLKTIGTLQMFAGIYRDFAGKSECGDFKFTGIACIPAIPVIFEVNQNKKCDNYMHFTGHVLQPHHSNLNISKFHSHKTKL